MTAAVLSTELTFALVGGVGPMPHGPFEPPRDRRVEMRWGTDDPARVVLVFDTVTWRIAWEVLHAGLYGPAGLGGVFVSPYPWSGDGPHLHEIVLDGVSHRAALQVETGDLLLFVEAVARRRAGVAS